MEHEDRILRRKRVALYRERMKAMGLRPMQMWVPDVRTAAFAKEARRQSGMVAQSEGEADDQAFVDAIADWDRD